MWCYRKGIRYIYIYIYIYNYALKLNKLKIEQTNVLRF